MRILYVDLVPARGGSVISLEQLVGCLDRTTFVPTVLLSARSPAISRFEGLGIPVITVPTVSVAAVRNTALVRMAKQTATVSRWRSQGFTARLWGWLRALRDLLARTLPLTWRLYRIMCRVRPDLVHVNDAIYGNRPVIAAAWLARRPALCHVRSLGPLGFWDRLWARTLRSFIFISQWVADDQAAQGVLVRRGRVIHNGIDPASYGSIPERRAARFAVGLPPDRPVVAVLGRLVPWKGQDLFLHAMSRVREAIPDVLGLIVGEPEEWSVAYAEGLRSLAAELGLAEAVRFTGYLSDVTAVLAATDVVAHTSVAPEPFGRVLIEAMAAGRPVVSPAEGGGLEIVIDGETGLLYEPRNPVALAEAIIRLLRPSGRAEACAMAAAGRDRVVDCFTLERTAAAVSDLYRELERTSR